MKTKQKDRLTCIDHTVTKEEFHLEWDSQLEMYITTPRPDEEDLYKYYASEAYISHTDSKDSFIDKLYQTVKNYTIKQKVKLVEPFRMLDKTILDIGCGTGDFLVACKVHGWAVHGIEPNGKAKQLAVDKLDLKTNSKDKRIIYKDIQELVESNQRYDVITMWHVLEHVSNLKEYVKRLKGLLNTNGTLIIAVPNFNSFDAEHYKDNWAAYDVPRHLWHFSKKSIAFLFAEVGLEVTKTLPMKFDAYYVSLLSEKYKTGRSNLIKAFYYGFISNLKAKRTKEYSSMIYVIKHAKNQFKKL